MNISVAGFSCAARALTIGASALALAMPCLATSFSFSTVADLVATVEGTDAGGVLEGEAGDAVTPANATATPGGAFTGIVVGTGAAAPTLDQVVRETYRVFPSEPDAGRAPTGSAFTAPQVPLLTTLQAAPSDAALGGGSDSVSIRSPDPFDLPANHYPLVPEVEGTDGAFLWLARTLPILAPAVTPFAADLRPIAVPEPYMQSLGTEPAGRASTPNGMFRPSRSVPASTVLALLALVCIVLAVRWRRRH